jgi:hypothetical protein
MNSEGTVANLVRDMNAGDVSDAELENLLMALAIPLRDGLINP